MARLLRTPWLLPAFGAASVATAVFLVRVLKNPEAFPVTQSQPTDEVAGQPPTPWPAPAVQSPAAQEKASPAAKMAGTKKPDPKSDAANRLPSRAATAASSERFAQPPPPRPSAKPVVTQKKKAVYLDEPGAASSAPARAMAPTASSANGTVGGGPSGMAAPTNTPETTGAVRDTLALPSRPSPSPTAAALARPSPQPAEAEQAKDEVAPREGNIAKDKVSKVAPTLAESTRKADRLYANQEWNEAAEAYRDLLRRFPNDKDVPKWRERLRTATITVPTPK